MYYRPFMQVDANDGYDGTYFDLIASEDGVASEVSTLEPTRYLHLTVAPTNILGLPRDLNADGRPHLFTCPRFQQFLRQYTVVL